MADNSIVKKSIQIDAGDTLRTVKSLKQEIADLRDELLNLEKGTEEYDEVQKQLQEDVNDLNEVMGAHKEKAQALEGSYNDLQNQLKELKTAWKETNDEVERDEIGKKINELNGQLKEMDASIGDFHRNVGNYQSAWEGLTGVMENGEKITDDLEKGIKAFGTAMGLSDKQVKALSTSLKALKDGFKIAKDITKAKEASEGAAVATQGLATAEKAAAVQGTALATSQKTTAAAATTMAAGETAAATATKGLSVAMTGLKAALLATGIGALIVLIGQLSGELDKLKVKIGSTKKSAAEMWNETYDLHVADATKERELMEHNLEFELRKLEAQGAAEMELLEKREQGLNIIQGEMLDLQKKQEDDIENTKKEIEQYEKLTNTLKALHPILGLVMDKLSLGKFKDLKAKREELEKLNTTLENTKNEVSNANKAWGQSMEDIEIQRIKDANKELKGTTEELRKWEDLLKDPSFRQAWSDLFSIKFEGNSPIEVLKAQKEAAIALVQQFKGDTSEVERYFEGLISDAEAEWKSLVDKEKEIFDERLTPAQRLENEKQEWIEKANKWGMDTVNLVKYYDEKIKEENKKAEDAITAQQEAAQNERLEALRKKTDEQLQMMEATLDTQEKLDELFNTRGMEITVFGKKGTVQSEIEQDMEDIQRLYDTQMEYLNGLLESADLTEEAYAAVEDRIRSLTVVFNNQMNRLKEEQEYQGKNFRIISKKWEANLANMEQAAGDFADAFAAGGEKTVGLYKGFALAQSLIAAFLAANEVLAAEPGEMFTKLAAAAATFAVAIGNVMSIVATEPDGSNASSMMSNNMQSATPVIGNSTPINYTRNITTAAEQDEMNQPIYVTVTDIEDGINGHRAQVTNSSF